MEATAFDQSEHVLLTALRDVDKALAAAHDAMTFVTDPGVLGDAVLEMQSLSATVDGLRTKLVGQAKANGVPQAAGVRTVGQFVGSQSNRSPEQTNRDARHAAWLAYFPTIADAFYTGQITTSHVTVLRRLDTARSRSDLYRDQTLLVDAAVGVVSFDNFILVVESWLIANDPDGEEPREQLAANAVRYRRGAGGRGTITADLDAASFAAAKTMIDHQTDALRAEANGPVVTDHLINSVPRDRMAAFMALMTKGFQRDDGTLPVPIFNFVMSETVAEWAIERLLNPDAHSPFDTVPVDPFDVDGRCELIDGTQVHPLLIVAATGLWKLGAPALRRYVMNAKGRIVDYSYNARVAPEHLRTASMIEHRGRCKTAGCDVPHSWLQIDHEVPHSKGGPTSLANVGPLCAPDNQAKGTGPGFKHRRMPEPPDDPDDGATG